MLSEAEEQDNISEVIKMALSDSTAEWKRSRVTMRAKTVGSYAFIDANFKSYNYYSRMFASVRHDDTTEIIVF